MDHVTPYDVFCSYCWRDRTAVEAVAQALQRQGLKVFLDRWYLIPGRPWPRALEEILASCRAVAVFVGPQGLGDWQQREAFLALNRKDITGVIPVLLPGADPALGFLSLHTWVDLRPGLDDPLSLEILSKAIRGESPGSDLRDRVQATLAAVCPYRGLRPFREEDAPFFFGRQTFIERLTQAVSRQTLVALVGASGCGKSSVARAGLIPRLRSQEGSGLVWETVTLLPGDRPLQALAASLLPLLEPKLTVVEQLREVNKLTAYLQTGDLALRDVVARVLAEQPGTDRLHLVVDQWEELYTLTREEEPRRRFLDEIIQATQDSPLSVVLTLRGDFFGQALRYRPLADRLQEAVVTLGPMTREELAQAIEKPANKVGLTFESGLVERLLDDVGQEPGNLPLLEFALTNLWERRQGGQLLHQAYDGMGRVQGALAQKAEELYQQLSPLDQQAANRIFLELVQPGGNTEDTRRRAPLTEMGAETRELVKKLTDGRLLVTGREAASGQEIVEVAHEALIQHWTRLQGWLNADREFLLWRQRQRHDLEDWERTKRDDGALLRGASLAEAEGWLTRRTAHLTPGERQFIQAGLALQKRERLTWQRQQRFKVLALTTGLVLALILMTLAAWQWWRAEGQRRLALSRQLATQARSLMESKLDLAILLSLEAWRLENTVEAKSALYTALFKDFRLQSLLHGADGPVYYVALSPDGRTLATASALSDHTIMLWDVASRRPKGPPLSGKVGTGWHPQIVFSPDGKTLAAADQGVEELFLWDTETLQPLGPTPPGQKTKVTWLAFSPDGSTLAAGLVQDGLLLLDVPTRQWRVQSLQGLPKWPITMAYNFKGQLLAVGHSDNLKHSDYNIITLWNLSTGEPLGSLLREFERRPHPLAFNPEGTVLASAGATGRIILWDVKTQKPLEKSVWFFQFGENLDSMSFSPDGNTLAAGAAGNVFLWNIAGFFPIPTILKGIGSRINSFAFSPDGKTLAVGAAGVSFRNRQGNLMLWEAEVWPQGFGKKAQEPVYLRDILRRVQSMYNCSGLPWSPDGKIAAVFDDKAKAIQLVDAETERPLGPPIADQAKVNAFCFSPDSRTLAAGYDDTTIRLWDVHSHQPLGPPLKGHDSKVSSLAFSPDGSVLASGSEGNSPKIFLWEVKTGKSLGPSMCGHTQSVNSLAFSPKGKILVSGSQDYTIRMWDTASLKPLGPPLQDHEYPVSGVAFSPDGHNLASISKDGVIKLWDVASRQPLCNICKEAGYIDTRIAFSADGQSLLTWAAMRWVGKPWEATNLKIWQISMESLIQRACRLANRNLTHAEWQRYLGDLPYRPTCRDLPVPED